MNHEKTHQTNPMAPWDPLDALLTPWDPWQPLNRPPQTHKQVFWPHCTLKITSTALQINLTPSPLQMINRRIRPLANDHLEGLATCKWSSGGSSHLQMIIQRIRLLASDCPEDLGSCKWSSGGTGLLQMITRHPKCKCKCNHLAQDPAIRRIEYCIWFRTRKLWVQIKSLIIFRG